MELGTGRTQHLDVLTGPALLTQFSADGKTLAVAQKDARISVISMETGKLTVEIPGVADRVVQSLAFSPDGKWLAATTRSGLIQVFDVASGKEETQWLPGAGWPKSLAWSPQGDRLAVGNRESMLRVFRWPGGEQVAAWKADIPVVDDLRFSPDGQQLLIGLTARQNGQLVKQPVRLWDYEHSPTPKGFTGHQFGVPTVAFLPDGKLLTAAFDWTVRSWDPEK
jgi:WD40 repeat protein